MKIYIDDDNKCYVSPADGLREIEAPEFDGYCAEYIEGMRLVPESETWTNEDGYTFEGRMVAAWKDHGVLCKAQAEYEHKLLLEYEAALTEIETALGVTSE